MSVYVDLHGNSYEYEIEYFSKKITINNATIFESSFLFPDYIEGIPVSYIAKNAFENNWIIKNITFHGNLKRIEDCAFKGCLSLENVFFLDEVEAIWDNVFQDCRNLKFIELPETIKYLGKGIFQGCNKLDNFSLKNNKSGYYTHEGIIFNSNNKELVYYPPGRTNEYYRTPEGITSIGSTAFATCDYLKELSAYVDINQIKEYAFYNCKNLDKFQMYSGIQNVAIDRYAFKGCISLNDPFLGEVQKLGEGVFEGCGGLVQISINGNFDNLGKGAFKNCSNLEKVYLHEGIREIGAGCFVECKNLYRINFPKSIFQIWDDAFLDCRNLFIILLENENIRLHKDAFKGCINLLFELPKTKNVYYSTKKIDLSSDAWIEFNDTWIKIEYSWDYSDADGDSICEHGEFHYFKNICELVSNLENDTDYFDITKADEDIDFLYDSLESEMMKKALLLMLTILARYKKDDSFNMDHADINDFAKILSQYTKYYEYDDFTR
jgi:hypothetical protein